jgi:hypothetical protein
MVHRIDRTWRSVQRRGPSLVSLNADSTIDGEMRAALILPRRPWVGTAIRSPYMSMVKVIRKVNARLLAIFL